MRAIAIVSSSLAVLWSSAAFANGLDPNLITTVPEIDALAGVAAVGAVGAVVALIRERTKR